MTRCTFGFHSWSQWGTPFESPALTLADALYNPHAPEDVYTELMQLRTCARCGIAHTRRLGTPLRDGNMIDGEDTAI